MMKEKGLRNINILQSYLMFLFYQASWFWLIKSVTLGFGPAKEPLWAWVYLPIQQEV